MRGQGSCRPAAMRTLVIRQERTVAEIPEGYRPIPPEDQKKAEAFFRYGRAAAETANYEYAIEMFLQGLSLDPENVEAHKELREISLKRKASGGKSLGMFDAMKLKRPSKDDKQNMLNAEKLLAYDPGNTDVMVTLLQSAHRAGFYDTVLWIGPILQQANFDSNKPNYSHFIILKDIYKDLKQWKLATDACQYAAQLRPDNMDLQSELKNLGAQHTMDKGGYQTATSFRQSIRDLEGQKKLLDAEKDVMDLGILERAVRDAEAEWKADPDDPAKLTKLIDALERTEDPNHENRALELLEEAYKKTRQFKYRQRSGKIKMAQMRRMERSLRAALQASPDDPQLKKDYAQFRQEQAEFELAEYTLWAENYPTEMQYRYEQAVRQFQLRLYDQAIPNLQRARSDPRYRFDAGLLLGQAFLMAGFVDEAIDTLGELIESYPLQGDAKSKEMFYWQGRALEQKGEAQLALQRYSKVAQWDFNYQDVQQRIRKLRAGPGSASAAATAG